MYFFCRNDSGLQDRKSYSLASQKKSVFPRHVDLLPGLEGLYSNLGCDTGARRQTLEKQWNFDAQISARLARKVTLGWAGLQVSPLCVRSNCNNLMVPLQPVRVASTNAKKQPINDTEIQQKYIIVSTHQRPVKHRRRTGEFGRSSHLGSHLN